MAAVATVPAVVTKSATEVIDYLVASGTGKDKVAILREWVTTERLADGEALLAHLLDKLDAGGQGIESGLKDETAGITKRVVVGRGTLEKIGRLLHGRDWQIPGVAPSAVEEAADLKQKNAEMAQELSDKDYELAQAKAEIRALKEKQAAAPSPKENTTP